MPDFVSICALVRRIFDVEFSITDYLFWIRVVHVGWSWLIYLPRESDTLIQVSYHTQTAWATQKRAPDTLMIKRLKYVYNVRLDNGNPYP